MKEFLLGQSDAVEAHHREWAEQLKTEYGEMSEPEQAESIVRKELGKKFVKALEDAGVFKDREAFMRFIRTVNHQG